MTNSFEALDGELSLQSNINNIRLRSSLSYDLDSKTQEKLRTFRLSGQKKLGQKGSVRVASNYSFPTDILSLDTRYSRAFDPVTIDFDFGGDSEKRLLCRHNPPASALQPRKTGYAFRFNRALVRWHRSACVPS